MRKKRIFQSLESGERLYVVRVEKSFLVRRDADVHRGGVADGREVELRQVRRALCRAAILFVVEPSLAKGEVRLYRMERRTVNQTSVRPLFVVLPHAVVVSASCA